MNNAYTYKSDYAVNGQGYFGAVDVLISSRFHDKRVVRIARKTKEAALLDAGKLKAAMIEGGPKAEINLNDYN